MFTRRAHKSVRSINLWRVKMLYRLSNILINIGYKLEDKAIMLDLDLKDIE